MGRGTLYLMISNGAIFLVGYVIHFALGRYLGPADYGIFGVVLSILTVVNIFLISGFPQSASKHIAEGNAQIGSIMLSANRIQLLFCAIAFGLYFGLADVIANLLNDASLAPYLRLSALALPGYALYAIYGAGYLNGLRQFGKQALASIGSSIAKAIAVFSLVLLGFGVKGAIVGYLIAALVGFLLAWILLRPIERGKVGFGWRKLVAFGVPATLFSVLFFLLLGIDLYMVKAIVEDKAQVGYYTAANTLSKMPYLVFASLAFTLLPSISKSSALNDVELTRSYIRQSMRYMLMLLMPGVLLISATSTDIITLFYSARYSEAAEPLSILMLGLGLLIVFFVLAHVIMGSGRPRVALWMVMPLVAMDIILNLYLVPEYGLSGAALATTITGLTGMCTAAIYVFWRFKALANMMTVGRICLASLAVYLIALNLSTAPAWLPLIYIGLLALYAGILLLTRELKREDLEIMRRILHLKGGDGGGKPPDAFPI